MNCLRPLITHWSPFSTARVCIAASGALYGSQRSEAPRGSVRQCASRNPGSFTMRGNQSSCRWRGATFRRRIERNAAEFLGDAQSADSDLVGLLEDSARQARIRVHQPLALPVLADERRDEIVDEGAAATAHQALLFG